MILDSQHSQIPNYLLISRLRTIGMARRHSNAQTRSGQPKHPCVGWCAMILRIVTVDQVGFLIIPT